MRIVAFIIALLVHIVLQAQTYTGRVQAADGKPLAGASVVATAEGRQTLTYSITDSHGQYRLTLPAHKQPALITIAYMGYQTKTIPFANLKNDMTITLTASGLQLKEVKVKAERLRHTGDTLTYSVAGFRQAQDRSIADVIAKMPGLEVKADGKIEYQGKPINKFYIEGLDLMGSQYGIANQNISADKVQSVQVLENHQSVKSLRGVAFSEQAALNLVLRDDAKAVWTGTADIGLGYGHHGLYDCRLMGMRFSKQRQALMMYKNNNIGKQLDSEVLDLAALLKGRTDTEEGILSLLSVDAPDLAENRYTFNHSHLLAGNWLWRTGKDSELRLQGNGFMDKTYLQSYHSSTYLTLADLPVIVEEQDVTNTRSQWKGEAHYQYNGAKSFVRNHLKGYMDFNKSVGTMLYDGQGTDLMVRPRKRSVTDDFQLSHTTAQGHVYTIESYWAYHYLPGQLLTIGGTTQRLTLGFLSTQNDVSYKLKMGRHYLNNTFGLNYDHQRISADQGQDTGQRSAYQLLRAYWTPAMSFILAKHRVEIQSMLSLARQSYRGAATHHLWADPSLSWNWKPTVISQFSAHIDYTNRPLMGQSIYDTPLFTSYRTLRVNRGTTHTLHTLQATAAYQLADPVRGLFLNIRPIYSRTTGNILYESTLQANVYTLTATDRQYATQTAGLSGRISKTFSWAKTLVALSASHHVTDYSLLVAGAVNRARMGTTTTTLSYSLRPIGMLSVEGKSAVRVYRQKNRTVPERSPEQTTDWEHFLNLHLLPARGWMLSARNELFHSNDRGAGTNYFLDIAASYKAKRWELALTASNLIGTSRFERRTLSNTIEAYDITRLRPREFTVKWSTDL